MPVHILLAMAINPSILKKITTVVRDFLWHGRKEARAGCCLVSWPKISRPLKLGGLAVHDLHRTGIALRARWLWLQATDPDRPWIHLPLPKDEETKQFFRTSMTWTLGDGRTCQFWTDHWLHGQTVAEIALSLLLHIPRRRRRNRSVRDGIMDRT